MEHKITGVQHQASVYAALLEKYISDNAPECDRCSKEASLPKCRGYRWHLVFESPAKWTFILFRHSKRRWQHSGHGCPADVLGDIYVKLKKKELLL